MCSEIHPNAKPENIEHINFIIYDNHNLMAYSKKQINKAGEVLKDKVNNSSDEIMNAEDVLTYWRTIHSPVISDFHDELKLMVNNISKSVIIVQRIKRSHSIIRKLNRLDGMQLARMQDIAGIRVILNDITEVYRLIETMKSSEFTHELKNEKDYIKEPKESGYRGIHLIYKYINPEKAESNGLYIEVQIRTKIQHIWATAVETMSTFLGTHLKFDEGQPKWLNYFALTSFAYSFVEKSPSVPKYSKYSEQETLELAIYEYNYNKINEALSAYSVAANFICNKVDEAKKYHIVTLDTKKRVVNVKSFTDTEIDEANKKYTEIERENSKIDTKQSVLVSSESIHELQDGFPNYFLDIKDFLNQMESMKKKLADSKKK